MNSAHLSATSTTLALGFLLAATSSAQELLLDVNLEAPGTSTSRISGLTEVGDLVYFSARTGNLVDRLWKTDGTPLGTQPVMSFTGTNPVGLLLGAEFDGRLFFAATDAAHGLEPWMSDGTPEGTYLLADLLPGTAGSNWGLPDHAIVGDRLYFTGFGASHAFELYSTDGTPEGTRVIDNADLSSALGLGGGSLFAAGESLYFTGIEPITGVSTYRFDTVTETLTTLGQFNPNGDDAPFRGEFASLPTGLLFVADEGVHGFELWIDEGNSTDPYLLRDLEPGPSGSLPSGFATLGDLAFFSTGTQFGPSTLWASDGTAAGTIQLANNESFIRSSWTVCRDVAFVWAVDVVGQDSLFVTDGTVAGTRIVLSTSFQSSFSTAMTPIGSGNLVAFQNYDPTMGIETWISDGTVNGTKLVEDGWPGIHSVQPSGFARAGNSILLAGRLPAVGLQPLRFDLFELGGHVVETYGDGCPGSSGAVPAIDVVVEPSVSTPFGVIVEEAAANSIGFAYYSESKMNLAVGACTLHVPLSIPPIAFTTDGGGNGSIPTILDPSFAGRRLFAQAFVFDVGGALFGLASATPGLEMVVGL